MVTVTLCNSVLPYMTYGLAIAVSILHIRSLEFRKIQGSYNLEVAKSQRTENFRVVNSRASLRSHFQFLQGSFISSPPTTTVQPTIRRQHSTKYLFLCGLSSQILSSQFPSLATCSQIPSVSR